MCHLCRYPLEYRNGTPVVSMCLKIVLFAANFIMWLVGGFMLAVGFYAKLDKGLAELPLDPVTPVLIIGALLFFITFFGFVGALRENLCMLTFFSYAVAFALLAEVTLALLSVVLSDRVRSEVENLMSESIVHYRDDPDLQNIIDWGQEEFECCGVHSLKDWGANIYFNCSDFNPSLERCGVPYSCCKPPDDGVVDTFCGMNVQNIDLIDAESFVHTFGCSDAIAVWFHDNMFYLACLIFIFCCIPQILGVTMSRILIIQIKDQEFYIKIGLLNSRGDFEMNSSS